MDLWKHQIFTCCPPSAVVVLEVVVAAAVAAAPLFLLRPMALDFRIPVGIQMIYGRDVRVAWFASNCAHFQNPNPERDRSFSSFTRSALPFLARPLDGRLTRFFLPSIKVSIPLTHFLFSLSLCINYISLLRCATSARKQDPPPSLSPSPSIHPPSNVYLAWNSPVLPREIILHLIWISQERSLKGG